MREAEQADAGDVGDYIGSYFMDDRAPVAALRQFARMLRDSTERADGDLYLVFTTNEEIGGVLQPRSRQIPSARNA